jgi:hypothetical protein
VSTIALPFAVSLPQPPPTQTLSGRITPVRLVPDLNPLWPWANSAPVTPAAAHCTASHCFVPLAGVLVVAVAAGTPAQTRYNPHRGQPWGGQRFSSTEFIPPSATSV